MMACATTRPIPSGAQDQALERVLAKAKRDGKLTLDESVDKSHVKKLLAAAAELGDAVVKVLTRNDVTAMRKRARTMLVFSDGVVDLGVGVRPGARLCVRASPGAEAMAVEDLAVVGWEEAAMKGDLGAVGWADAAMAVVG